IRPGDVMILVRRRGPMFTAILRALEEARVPVAGTDRLKLTEALAVQDLMSLLRFLATPTDDLALAEVLRSPLGGISEEDLFALAHGRPKLEQDGRSLPLWRRVWEAKKTHPALFKMLKDLRDQADFLRPFELLERALVLHEGRAALTGRLGPEAEDAIDALLNSALAYEQVEAPNLTGFIEWFAAQDVEVKREFAQDLNQVRVMTVHGAKGLEAPIVFLPDTAKRSGPGSLRLGRLAEQPVWPSSSGTNPATWQEERNRLQALDEAEDWRLLYVAMTRAERALIVCGAGKDGQDGSGSWYDAVAQGLAALETEEGPDGTLVFGDLGLEHKGQGAEEAQTASHTPPDWARDKVSVPQMRPIHAPSDLGGAHALVGSAEDTSPDSPEDLRTRGTQIHLLLEHLPRHPAAQHKAFAASLLRDITPDDALL
ncbi:MAG: 3'-5' exonuclease, partial [Pseudomonadota bacterium]